MVGVTLALSVGELDKEANQSLYDAGRSVVGLWGVPITTVGGFTSLASWQATHWLSVVELDKEPY